MGENGNWALRYSTGISVITMLILYISFFWNTEYGQLTTLTVLYISLIGFLVGLVLSLILYRLYKSKEFGLLGLSVFIFSVILWILVGDVKIELITMSTLVSVIAIVFAFQIVINLLLMVLQK